jgi:hypothetical protein
VDTTQLQGVDTTEQTQPNPTTVTDTCVECGNDDACEGWDMCSDCLDRMGTDRW